MTIAMQNPENILKVFALRNTESRNAVLSYFLSKKFALTHADIEQEFSEQFDRVTIYRILKIFLEKGILHKVLDDEANPKYALCQSPACDNHHHNHNHIHFKCEKCGKTKCINDVIIPIVNLPKSYKVQEINILINGFCEMCENKN
jgi:Fur family transcriptional regulator, ferric uptake regulator